MYSQFDSRESPVVYICIQEWGGDLRSAKLSPAFAQHRSFHYLVTYSRSSKRRFNAMPTFWQSEFLKLGLHDLQATHVAPEGFSQAYEFPTLEVVRWS